MVRTTLLYCAWRSLPRSRGVPLRLLVAALLLLASQSAPAARPEQRDAELLQSQLAAGEFGPALALVRQERDPAARDEHLDQVAAAQARAGAQSAAIKTAAEIESDLARSKALGEIAAARRTPTAGAAGGGVVADFNSLMDLIKSTVAPTTWDDTGGSGSMEPFRGGVYVDAEGVLQRSASEEASGWLARVHQDAATRRQTTEVRRQSPLRKVSLPRLERLVALRLAAGLPLDEEMRVLAGLQRIEYVLVYPDSGDLVLAGPAGDWRFDHQARPVSAETGRPLVQLDDLVTIWRHTADRGAAALGCTILPTEKGLAEAQVFLASSQKRPLKPGGRTAWLEEVRRRVGRQKIEVFGIDPRTSTARILVEADRHMKFIGLGLEPATVGMSSYLDSIQVPRGQSPPPVDVLRWWFTMNYEAIRTSPRRDAFALRGQAVQVQSENELLAEQGRRVPTNRAEPLNREFAANFTRHFEALAATYPIYAELQNIFDLTLAGALIESGHLAEGVAWHRTCFGPGGSYVVPLGPRPQTVETVVNHRMVNGKHILAGVSGGVHADPRNLVNSAALRIDGEGRLDSQRAQASPAAELPRDTWWWD